MIDPKREKLDYWSWVHLTGCFVLTSVLYFVIGNLWTSLFVALFLGYVWEVFDELFHEWGSDESILRFILDARGLSILDTLFNLTGCVLAFIIWSIV